jgi:hypothetical protein
MRDPSQPIEVRIEREAQSLIIRSALRHYRSNCVGFVIGQFDGEPILPHLEFSVVSTAFERDDPGGLDVAQVALARDMPKAERLASEYGRHVIAVWVAWDTYKLPDSAVRLKWFEDFARVNLVPHVVECMTDGGENLGGIGVYWSSLLTQIYLKQQITHRSVWNPQDNPRRVQSAWRKIQNEKAKV